jgi:hypothetical protein
MSTFTLVRVPEGDDSLLLCKVVSDKGTADIPSLPYLVEYSSFTAESVEELREALAELGDMPDVCIIRAEPLEPDRGPQRRKLTDDPKTGDKATLRNVPRDWVLIDFDSLPCPKGIDFPKEPHRAAEYLRGTLPEAFRVAGCVWRASSNAGLKEGIRLHLWFLLSTPVDTSQLNRWLGGLAVDTHVFAANHPHFTANPRFEGRPDPMSARIGVLLGSERVIVPDLAVADPERSSRSAPPASDLDPFTARALRQWEGDHPSRVEGHFDCAACQSPGACVELPDGKWFCFANGHKDRAPTIGSPTRTPGGVGYVGHRFEFVTNTSRRDIKARLTELGYVRRPPETTPEIRGVIDEALTEAAKPEVPTVKELDKARRELAAGEKVVRSAPSQLAAVAEQLGRLCPTFLDTEAVRQKLVDAAVNGAPRGLALVAPDAERVIDGALKAGGAKPKKARSKPQGGAALQRDDQGNLLVCYANVLALCSMPELLECVAYDERSHRLCVMEAPWITLEDDRTTPRWLDDSDLSWIVALLANHYDYPHATPEQVHKAVSAVASERLWDPVRNYLDERTWEGSLDDARTFLGETAEALFGVHGAYPRAVFTRWVIAAVQRTFEPGCMFRQLLVLIGPQGIGKSSVLRKLCMNPAWFCDTIHDFGSKDSRSALDGKWIIELAELDKHTLGDKYDAGALKSYISTQTDSYRRSYARLDDDFLRRCVFAATSNVRELLRDPTGGSRFNVLDCVTADAVLAEELRDDVWGAAKALYDAGEPSYLQGDEVAAATREQAAHYAADPVEVIVEELWTEPVPGAARFIGASPLGFEVCPEQVDEERMLVWVTSTQLQEFLRKKGVSVGRGNALKVAAQRMRSMGLVHGRVSKGVPSHGWKKAWGRPICEMLVNRD